MQTVGWCLLADGVTHFIWYKRSIILAIPLGLLYTFLLKDIVNPFLFALFYSINYSLAIVVEPDLDQLGLTSSEGRAMRGSKRAFFGLFGAFWVMWWFLYAWLIGLVGGHRSVFSHGIGIGTVGRIIWFNLPFAVVLYILARYWGWEDWWYQLYLDIWLLPYILSQFLAWFLSDGFHLMLDTEWSKGILYTPINKRKY